MRRSLSATPCPFSEATNQDIRRNSTISITDDTTTTVDFTTEFRASFRDVKPRRPPYRIKRVAGNDLGFTIHEDKELQIQNVPEPQPRGCSVLSRAARRTSRRESSQWLPGREDSLETGGLNRESAPGADTTMLYAAPKRASSLSLAGPTRLYSSSDDSLPTVCSPKITKPARRGTIYIPTDDTTMPSIYMGIFSPLKNEPLHFESNSKNAEHTGIAAQMLKKRSDTRRQSALSANPRRGQLGVTTNLMQSEAESFDRAGNGPGKENLPPSAVRLKPGYMKKQPRKSILISNKLSENLNEVPAVHHHRPVSKLFEPTTSSMARLKDRTTAAKTVQKPIWNSGRQTCAVVPTRPRSAVAVQPSAKADETPQARLRPSVPSRLVIPSVKIQTRQTVYPVLQEGIVEASMYEDNWLGQQEIAISQLINNLFAASHSNGDALDSDLLRIRLLAEYNSPRMSSVYKSIQGALFCGALSLPPNVLARGGRLYNDVGLRKAFTDLWLENYDNTLLQVALEVVTGRVVHSLKGWSEASPQEPTAVGRKRVLKLFLETLLMRNEDGNPDTETDSAAWAFHRTVLRSLMLIKVLDLIKTSIGMSGARLFLIHSSHKSSASVVQTLMQMLNPSAGDPLRALNLLGYSVSHEQYPLEEYDYVINNLAVDLRNGVILTRLVELLLYRSASRQLRHKLDTDATMTLSMPTGEILDIVEGQRDWPLSQHLKFPCIGKATKLYNVQIALRAIQNVKGMEAIILGISAADVVEGFREKTMKLLWALTSKWGLQGLVDSDDIMAEIKRFGRSDGLVGYQFGYHNDIGVDEDEADRVDSKALLKAWAKTIAVRHGLIVRNFTTSFADGRVFDAIVKEYERYLTPRKVVEATRPLSERLRALGCSEQFAQLFVTGPGATSKHYVFDRDFVLASLAFLCSRLLSPSKRARAAAVIQQAWRARRRQRAVTPIPAMPDGSPVRAGSVVDEAINDAGPHQLRICERTVLSSSATLHDVVTD